MHIDVLNFNDKTQRRFRINVFCFLFFFVLTELNISDKKYTHHEYTCFYNWWEMSNTQNDVDQLLHPSEASLTTAKTSMTGSEAWVTVSSKSKSVFKKHSSSASLGMGMKFSDTAGIIQNAAEESSSFLGFYLVVLVRFARILTVALAPALWPWKTVRV